MSEILDQKMTRKEFLKKAGLTAGALALALKGMPAVGASAATFSDNLISGVEIGPNAPGSIKTLWVDTGDGGILKYYNGTEWTPAASGKATQLRNARTIQTNLGSTTPANFDGTANASAGVTGTLSPTNGGTGQTSLQATRNAMGLGNTVGALPVANGGTGATTAEASLKNIGALRQNNGIAQYWNGSSWVNCKSVWG